MSDDRHELRRQVGIVLRAIPVAVLALGWYLYLWWWIALLGIAAAIAAIILQPVAYPVLYAGSFVMLAFTNSKGEVLPGYWRGYPRDYLEWVESSLKLGFATLRRWLLHGFGS